jgi:hypothetical protein
VTNNRVTLAEAYEIATAKYPKYVPPTKMARYAYHIWAQGLMQSRANKELAKGGRIRRRLARLCERQALKHEGIVEDVKEDIHEYWSSE